MLTRIFRTSAFGRAHRRICANERGASLVEYTFLLTLVVVVTIGSIKFFGGTLTGSLAHSGNAVNNAAKYRN